MVKMEAANKVILLVVVVLIAVQCQGAVVRKGPLYGEATQSDFITHLPGLDEMPHFNMFSGYLEVGSNKKLHYWLNECIGSCNTLIIWFNGGPGCSSMDGFLTENGPYNFDPDTGRLVRNPYSWNRLAHTLYIESPAGVGFSYDDAPGETPLNDETVAADTMAALTHFFKKFSNLTDVGIYISGESYAGVYIPMLATEIIRSSSEMKERLKGLLIGNGLLHASLNDESTIYFAYYHGLFGTALWHNLVYDCCGGNPQGCEFYGKFQEECLLDVAKVSHLTSNDGINIYNIYQRCAPPEQELLMRYNAPFLSSSHLENSTAKWLSRRRRSLPDENLKLVPPCSNATLITDFLNKPEVQDAIHVRRTDWSICANDVYNNYDKTENDMSPYIKEVLEHYETDIRVLLYFGDVDMACNFMGGEWFADNLGYELISSRRKWTVIAEDGTEQVGGFFKEYDKLTYLTIRGAGHMVPTDKPHETFQMLEKYLMDEPFMS